jgi:DNA polymerase-3 subunit alpha
MEVSVPDLAASRTGPFVVSMPVQRCVAPVVDRLHEVLRSHPGLAEVHLRLCNGRRTTVVKLDDKLRVKPSPALVADLKQFLGPACVG